MMYEDRIYGKEEINDQLVLDIIKTPEMQRLKGVNQYGAAHCFFSHMDTTRFEHSIGVYLLLRKLGASREEQIAGLLHDVGHTVFSHAYDYVIGRAEEQDYNDEVQGAVIINSKIKHLLIQAGIDLSFILDHKRFLILENDIPNVCADRLDYLLRDSSRFGALTKEEADLILKSAKADSSSRQGIYFDNIEAARIAALRYMQMDSEFWRNPSFMAALCLIGEALKTGISKKVLKYDDFFKTDEYMMKKLANSGIPEIAGRLSKINSSIKVTNNEKDYDFFIKGKCRYIDPAILIKGNLVRTSDIDKGIKAAIDVFRKEYSKGHHIKIMGD